MSEHYSFAAIGQLLLGYGYQHKDAKEVIKSLTPDKQHTVLLAYIARELNSLREKDKPKNEMDIHATSHGMFLASHRFFSDKPDFLEWINTLSYQARDFLWSKGIEAWQSLISTPMHAYWHDDGKPLSRQVAIGLYEKAKRSGVVLTYLGEFISHRYPRAKWTREYLAHPAPEAAPNGQT